MEVNNVLDNERSQDCNDHSCPIDGNWGQWGQWSSCSVTCDGGTQERTRECNDPETQYGGIPCHGDDIQIINCNKLNCPIDGNWGTWSSWHGCSVSCGGGTQTSTRQCNNPPALYGGQQCPGDNERSQDCNDHSCPRCEDGWTNFTNKCYKKFEPSTEFYWIDAHENCQKNGAQLASIPNSETNSFIRSFSPRKKIYIGAIRVGPNTYQKPDTFTWTDGYPWIYTNWYVGQPDNKREGEFCVEMYGTEKAGTWNDLRCNGSFSDWNNFMYVCQKNILN